MENCSGTSSHVNMRLGARRGRAHCIVRSAKLVLAEYGSDWRSSDASVLSQCTATLTELCPYNMQISGQDSPAWFPRTPATSVHPVANLAKSDIADEATFLLGSASATLLNGSHLALTT